MTRLRTLSTILSFIVFFALISCSDDDVQNDGTSILESTSIFDVVRNNGSLSSLEAALNQAPGDLPSALSASGGLTLFAPVNGAFEDLAVQLGFETAEELLADIDATLLSQILTYHVLASDIGEDAFTDGPIPTLNGDDVVVSLLVEESGNTVRLLDATKVPQTNPFSIVTQSNPSPNNGTLHLIDKILLPQSAVEALSIDTRPNVVDWAVATEDLSILVDALTKTDLVGTVSGLEAATVLAPTNQAFADLLDVLGDDYNDLDDFDNETEIALLSDILTYHVIASRVESTDLMAGPVETVLADNSVEVIAEGGGFVFGDATATNAGIETADIDGINGVVHIIDKVLLPQSALDFLDLLASDDLATTVINNPQLSVLEEALIATELAGEFMDATNAEMDTTATNFTYFRPATVFAPTNDAFVDLLDKMGPDYTSIASFDTEEELALLKDILLYHVVSGNVASTDLSAGNVTTVGGEDIEIISVVGSEDFVIGDATNDVNANIDIPDVMARNGVAHVIDKVLLPEDAVDFVNSLNEEEDE